MTLTDYNENMENNAITDQPAVEAGLTLMELMSEAEKEGRLVNGIQNCALHLQNCADNVMACILADYGPTHDVSINIEHTLLEAYCMENDIKVLKVDSSNKIRKFLSTIQKNKNKYPDRSNDYTCILIKNPRKDSTSTMDTFLKFDQLHHVWGWHVIEFPV